MKSSLRLAPAGLGAGTPRCSYWCAENLAYFKVPRYIELREDLPKNSQPAGPEDVLRQEREDLVDGCFDRERRASRCVEPSPINRLREPSPVLGLKGS